MVRSALLIWFSALICVAPGQDDWRKPDELLRALELKKSDAVAVLDPEDVLAPRIAKRVRMVINANDPAAPPHAADLIVLYDALHGVAHREKFYPKLHHLLRPGGRVVNIDFSADPPGMPPEPKLPAIQAVQEFNAAGFHITKTIALLPFEYFQIFE